METSFIQWLRHTLPPHPQLQLGVGDDAAVLQMKPGAGCAMASDMLCEGSHFDFADCTPQQAGRKALAVNLSDMAAMAARPVAVTVSLALPRRHAEEYARGVIEGMLPLAEQHGVAIAGGDTTTWDGPLAIDVAIIGEAPSNGVWRRGDARAGDAILVTGALGGSLSGRHLSFEPRVREAQYIAANYTVHAAADISDGLSLDLSNILQESRVAAVLDLEQIPISDAAHRAAETSSRTALQHALGDGEDFELLLTVPAETAEAMLRDDAIGVQLTAIGKIIAGQGLFQSTAGGVQPLEPSGYRH